MAASQGLGCTWPRCGLLLTYLQMRRTAGGLWSQLLGMCTLEGLCRPGLQAGCWDAGRKETHPGARSRCGGGGDPVSFVHATCPDRPLPRCSLPIPYFSVWPH